MSSKKFLYLAFFCLILVLSAGGCNHSTDNKEKEQAAFDQFINGIFVDEVQTDSITLNYSLSEPEKYGISLIEPTLGDYNLKSMEEGLVVSENYLATLKNFKYKRLTKEQQLTYDILFDYLELGMESSDLLLYRETLSPTTGIQAQLPILLAEYNFYQKDDIETYLSLLSCVPGYFNQILEFEREKSQAGLFMSDSSADAIIKQCREFISNPEDNYLIEVFNDKVASYSDLTAQEKKSYQKQNKKNILTQLVPAYEALIEGLTDLKGTGKNTGGLCGYPKGTDYYQYLVASSIGSSKSIEEIDALLDSSLQTSITNMASSLQKDPDIFDKIDSLTYPYTDPEEIITYLKSAIKKDFPALENVNCTIKYVHDSLEDSLSPAFYLSPPMDNFTENSIYINNGKSHGTTELFTTLAHEGYPGHLYQTVYYNQQNPVPLRNLLSFGGYSEGWATYVELYSYQMAELDDNIASILENNMIATLDMYGKIDIGVNYYGWDINDTADYLSDFGIANTETVKTIHASMIEEPANYLKYTLGYLEIIELRDKAREKLGKSFNLKDFHTFLLDIGPAQFELIDERLEQWAN